MTSLRKDESHKVSRLVAGGSAKENREANDQEHPAKLSWPATVAELIRDLRGDDHALVRWSVSIRSQVVGRIRRTTAALP